MLRNSFFAPSESQQHKARHVRLVVHFLKKGPAHLNSHEITPVLTGALRNSPVSLEPARDTQLNRLS